MIYRLDITGRFPNSGEELSPDEMQWLPTSGQDFSWLKKFNEKVNSK